MEKKESAVASPIMMPSAAIRRFSVVDSSDEDLNVPPLPSGRFDDSDLNLSLNKREHNNKSAPTSSRGSGDDSLTDDSASKNHSTLLRHKDSPKALAAKQKSPERRTGGGAMKKPAATQSTGKDEEEEGANEALRRPPSSATNEGSVGPASTVATAQPAAKERAPRQLAKPTLVTQADSTSPNEKAVSSPPPTDGDGSPRTEYNLEPKWRKHMIRRRDGSLVERPAKEAKPTDQEGDVYVRGMRMLRQRDHWVEEMRKKKEASEKETATFKPDITKKAAALHRDAADVQGDGPSSALRKRLLLLELPQNVPECSFRPRLSKKSVELINKKRSEGHGRLPASERLYREKFVRDEMDRCALLEAEESHASKVTRRPLHAIQEHIERLHQQEKERVKAIESLQSKQNAELHGEALFVNTKELVDRLTSHEPKHAAKEEAEPTERFAPRVGRQSVVCAERARIRGLQRWFAYFLKPGDDALDLNALSQYTGTYASIASTIVSALLMRASDKQTWSADEYTFALLQYEKTSGRQIWKEKERAAHLDEVALHAPQISSVSELLLRGKPRPGSAHQRLYAGAREKQLRKLNEDLETQQQHLEEEEQRQQRRLRLLESWEKHRRLRQDALEESERKAATPAAAEEAVAAAASEYAHPSPHASLQKSPRPTVGKPPSTSPRSPVAENTSAGVRGESARSAAKAHSSLRFSYPRSDRGASVDAPQPMLAPRTSVRAVSISRSPFCSSTPVAQPDAAAAATPTMARVCPHEAPIALVEDAARSTGSAGRCDGAYVSSVDASHASDLLPPREKSRSAATSVSRPSAALEGVEDSPLSIQAEGESPGDQFFGQVRHCRTTLPRSPATAASAKHPKEKRGGQGGINLQKEYRKRINRLNADVYNLN